MRWNGISAIGSTFTSALRRGGLTPVRLVLIAGALVLFAFPFIFPFTGAASSPLDVPPYTDPPPPPDIGNLLVAFASASSSGAESLTPADLEVTLSAASELTVTVDYQVSGGTATGDLNTGSGIDYTLADGTLTFAPRDTSKSISVNILNDGLAEANETIVVTLSNPSNATLGSLTVHTYTILDNDGTPAVAFASASSSGAESITPANLKVTLSAAAELTVTVDYRVSGGTATGDLNTGSGIDYTLAAGTLTFTPGDTSKSISVNILNDGLAEADETIVVNLSDPSNAALGGLATHTYTIVDDDGVPTVAFAAANSSAAESAPTGDLEVILSSPSELPVTVDYHVAGGTAIGRGFDYTLTDGTLTFAQGETSQTIAVINVDDPLDESDETVLVTLSNPSNATLGSLTVHTYTILDNDGLPTVTFALASSSAAELVTQAIIEVTLSELSGLTAMVDFAVTGGTGTGAGIDYTLTAGTLTFVPGDVSESITITVLDDALVELDESVVVALSNPINATLGGLATHTYIILDNDFLENSQRDDIGANSGTGGNHINIGDGNTIGSIFIGDRNTIGDVNINGDSKGRTPKGKGVKFIRTVSIIDANICSPFRNHGQCVSEVARIQ